MGERFTTRALAVSRAIARAPGRHRPPPSPLRSVLVAHNLLLGDTLMLTPLLAKLRANHGEARITLLASPPFVPLYASRPYGVRALPFAPSRSATTRALLGEGPFDLALVVGDNRYSWLAAAMGARHIVAHSGDTSWTKDVLVDEQRPYESVPRPWGDMVADLVDGVAPRPYARGDWPAPPFTAFEGPARDYAVLHVGASTPLKYWLPSRWMEVAAHLEGRGIEPVWSGGPGEESVVNEIDSAGRYRSFAGRLDLAQLWHLVAGARALVAPDTGVAHLGRTTLTPSVTLFGPGSAVLCGSGDFWSNAAQRAITVDPFPCRDQRLLFRRELSWVRRCTRTLEQCASPRCMEAIDSARVVAALDEMLGPSS
ncbi:MAG: glycosyltransferase family 9 protein [Usitatibacter sp.]